VSFHLKRKRIKNMAGRPMKPEMLRDLKIILQARQTIYEMAYDRGYLFSPKTETLQEIFDLNNKNKLKMSFDMVSRDPKTFQLVKLDVIFELNDKIDKDYSKKTLLDYESQEMNVIIVHKYDLTSEAKKTFAGDYRVKFQVFDIIDLQYNPGRHAYSAKIRPLTDGERIELFKINRIGLNNLPRILSTDPLSKYYGWKTGQVIEVLDVDLSNETLVNRGISYYKIE